MSKGPLKEYLLEDFEGDDYVVYPLVRRYQNNNTLAVLLYGDDDEWFCDITVNLPCSKDSTNKAFVDTNNNPWMPDFLAKHQLAKPTGRTAKSGYCEYPEYEFDMSKLNYDKYSK